MLVLRFDELHQLELVQADPLIEISDLLLEQADSQYLSVGDNILTVHARNGEVSYGLRDHDDIREVWLAQRSDVTSEDLDVIYAETER